MQHLRFLAPLSLFFAGACVPPPGPAGQDTGDDGPADDDGDASDASDDGGASGQGDGSDGGNASDSSGTADAGEPAACEGVDPCAGTEGQLALYGIWRCAPEAQLQGNTSEISCHDALANCLANESLETPVLYYCEWDGWEIHRSPDPEGHCELLHGLAPSCEDLGPASCEEPLDPCAGTEGQESFLRYYGCEPSEWEDSSPAETVTCADAQVLCGEFLADDPGQSRGCMWNGRVLAYDEVVAGDCSELDAC